MTIVKEKSLPTKPVKPKPLRSKEAAQRLDHELKVYQIEMEVQNTELRRVQEELESQQIELEMQNEELIRIQGNLELSRNKFSELYDFAPVGYFIFDALGVIREANLTGATLLGVERGLLTDRAFTGFIADEEGKQTFSRHLGTVFNREGMQSCEIRLKGKDRYRDLWPASERQSGRYRRQGESYPLIYR
jgi:PAS domain-containing protein